MGHPAQQAPGTCDLIPLAALSRARPQRRGVLPVPARACGPYYALSAIVARGWGDPARHPGPILRSGSPGMSEMGDSGSDVYIIGGPELEAEIAKIEESQAGNGVANSEGS